MDKKVLVVTSCTGEKIYKPSNELTMKDFVNKELLIQREKELEQYITSAGEMYTGTQHKELMDGVRRYRQHGGDIDVAILSAGYGLLKEHDHIAPYEVTFNSMNTAKIKSWSYDLKITEELQKFIRNYDLVFFLLGDKYLQAVDWPLEVSEQQKLIFFAGMSSAARILWDSGYYMMSIGENDARYFKSGLIEIKGKLFSDLLSYIINKNNLNGWESIFDSPEVVREYVIHKYNSQLSIEDYLNENKSIKEQKLLTFYKELYPVEDELIAKNFKIELNYFMPENDDRVDPHYDFFEDRTKNLDRNNPILDDVYAHELHQIPQYHGILISKVNIDKGTKRKRDLVNERGIRQLLRIPENYPIMGDCGAFSYIKAEEPPYTTQEILEYYSSLGFNYGVSVDHLIVGPYQKDETERQRRYEITINNARDFIEKHRAGNYQFTPIGVAQGWDSESFSNAVNELIKMGYQYVALGGLAMEKSDKIFEILKAIAPLIPNAEFKMHLFGVARDMRVMKTFHKLGVTTFDSAAPLRKAWLGSAHNYHTTIKNSYANKNYAAIRIPEAFETKGRVKKLIQEEGADYQEIKKLEIQALQSLREYDQGLLGIEETLHAILNYDQLLGNSSDRKSHEDLYRQVLRDKPWQKCPCAICKQVGIDVIIFRGNNRNRRRGFHNTYNYFKQVEALKKQIGISKLVHI